MIECVPNFSEGRDVAVVREIVAAIESAPGVLLLGWESDADHNRSVVTFAGVVHAVVEAAILATRTDFLPLAEIDEEYRKLAVIVQKTGGTQEKEAFAFLAEHIAQVKRARADA